MLHFLFPGVLQASVAHEWTDLKIQLLFPNTCTKNKIISINKAVKAPLPHSSPNSPFLFHPLWLPLCYHQCPPRLQGSLRVCAQPMRDVTNNVVSHWLGSSTDRLIPVVTNTPFPHWHILLHLTFSPTSTVASTVPSSVSTVASPSSSPSTTSSMMSSSSARANITPSETKQNYTFRGFWSEYSYSITVKPLI